MVVMMYSVFNEHVLLDKVAVDGHATDQRIPLNQTRKMAKIPVVDFSSLSLSISDDANLNESDVQKTAEQLVDAFKTIGFVYLCNTGFPQQLVQQQYYNVNYNKQDAMLSQGEPRDVAISFDTMASCMRLLWYSMGFFNVYAYISNRSNAGLT